MNHALVTAQLEDAVSAVRAAGGRCVLVTGDGLAAQTTMAQLFKAGWLARMFALKADGLPLRTCAALGVFPPVYDLPSAWILDTQHMASRCGVYLNGQGPQVANLSGLAVRDAQRARLRALVASCDPASVWLVLGCEDSAGDPDGWTLLREVMSADLRAGQRVFWLRRSLGDGAGGGGPPHGADGGAAPVSAPAAANWFQVFAPGPDGGLGPLAARLSEQAPRPTAAGSAQPASSKSSTQQAQEWLVAGDYAAVRKWWETLPPSARDENARQVAAGERLMRAQLPAENARRRVAEGVNDQSLADATELWNQAGALYQEALEIAPRLHEAASNWGLALAAQAQATWSAGGVSQLADARRLWSTAGTRFAQALHIKPDKHDAATHWGRVLAAEARALAQIGTPQTLADARAQWRAAGQRFEQALQIKPNRHDAAQHWGNALDEEAQTVLAQGGPNALEEARRLWQAAGEHYELALQSHADGHDVAFDWGMALAAQGRAVNALGTPQALEEARSCWRAAGERFEQALRGHPDSHRAHKQWALILDDEARALHAAVGAQALLEARALWRASGAHFASALHLEPDLPAAANSWGYALASEAQAVAAQAGAEAVTEAQDLWAAAGARYAHALQLRPDLHDAAYNWGLALDDEAQAVLGLGTHESLLAARVLWKAAGERYAQALRIKPDKQEAEYNWANALDDEARALSALGTEDALGQARRLWSAAGIHYARALEIRPDSHDAAYNWGVALDDEAQAVNAAGTPEALAQARALWREAGRRYAQALDIKPDLYGAALNWGLALEDEAQSVHADDAPDALDAARALWRSARGCLERALAIQPDVHEAALHWGNAFHDEALALLAGGDQGAADEVRRLCDAAAERYAQALRIHPQSHEAAGRWGQALSTAAHARLALGGEASTREAIALWQAAGERFAQAVHLKADAVESWNGWGLALAAEAQLWTLEGSPDAWGTARERWKRAGERYATSLQLQPDQADAANNWGFALAAEAQALSARGGPASMRDARLLWKEAFDRYAQALRIQPDLLGAAANWALALLGRHQAELDAGTPPDVLSPLLDRAWRVLADAARGSEDAHAALAYTMACTQSLRGDVLACLDELEICRIGGLLPHWQHLLMDERLAVARQTRAFGGWWEQHFPDHPIDTV